jgi:hypothetical protein
VRIALRSISFYVCGPSPSARSGGTISGMGYLVPQPFGAGGNWAVSKFVFSITGDPRCPTYKTPIVAPEPSVERMAEAVHSTGGRIGTHISLRV